MEIIPENIHVEPNSIAIIGWEEGGAGQIHSWFEKTYDYRIACFVNPSKDPLNIDIEKEKENRDSRLFDYPMIDSFKDIPLITSLNWADVLLKLGINKVLITTGDNSERYNLICEAEEKGLHMVSAIHPTALIMEDAVIHENVVIHARAIVGYRTEVHKGAIINTNAQLDHHNVIEACSIIGPGVATAGNVTIGKLSYVWTRTTIINKIRVGANSVIGAGTVVIEDVPESVTVAGVPGKIIKEQSSPLVLNC